VDADLNHRCKDSHVPELRIAHTADLHERDLACARALLDDAFDDFTDDDWEHALGGVHATAWEGRELVAHASVVQRRLLHRGTALRTGYVEAVAVRADRRRRGLGGTMMGAIERVIRRAYDLGALGTAEDAVPFYEARDWQRWRGSTSTLSPTGIIATPDEDGGIFVLPVSISLDLDSALTCDWREGDVW
jgi:aminoglycoside 2'-N-acetyltransferase I